MLIWYANIPEETQWYADRQETPTALGISVPLAALFIGHLFIPFLGIMSRAVRRNKPLLTAWAVYMLVWHWYDLFYIISPTQAETKWAFGIPEVLCTLGIGVLFIGWGMRLAAGNWLVPVRDPRIGQSLAFANH
jgi:peptidoglycan/LPS O-acetylase OafA/YrhL